MIKKTLSSLFCKMLSWLFDCRQPGEQTKNVTVIIAANVVIKDSNNKQT